MFRGHAGNDILPLVLILVVLYTTVRLIDELLCLAYVVFRGGEMGLWNYGVIELISEFIDNPLC